MSTRYVMETDLVPNGRRALVMVKEDARWTLALFRGELGERDCRDIVSMLNSSAIDDDRLPEKWNEPTS